MSAPSLCDADFIALFKELGPIKTAERIGVTKRTVYERRERLEGKTGQQITGPAYNSSTRFNVKHDARIHLEVKNGVVLVGSDGHYWPGPASTAHRAFVHFAKELDPKVIVMNGDALDAATISRHPPIGWEGRPTLVDEIEACQERLSELELAPRKRGVHKIWTLGNHDSRFETRLATVAPEYAKLHGVHLKDSFPAWRPAWSCWLNNSVVVKHRWKGGLHATHNNTVQSGKSMVTGHLHSAKVTPYTDYSEYTRYGVDTGCLADPNGGQFLDYTEDNPKNWRSGFGVLTFHDGKLLFPELVTVWDENHVQFRGSLVKV